MLSNATLLWGVRLPCKQRLNLGMSCSLTRSTHQLRQETCQHITMCRDLSRNKLDAESDQQTARSLTKLEQLHRASREQQQLNSCWTMLTQCIVGLHAFMSYGTIKQRSGFLHIVPLLCSLPSGVSASLHSEPAPGL